MSKGLTLWGWFPVTLAAIALWVGACQTPQGGGGGGGSTDNTNVNDNGNGTNGGNDNGVDNENENENENENVNENDNGTGEPEPSFLFVVNNDGPSVTFYGDPEDLNGEILPLGQIGAGAATSLFQPRSLVVTTNGALFVSRQNGGIVGYDDAFTLNEDTTADRVIQGNNTRLVAPISFAYDPVNDRLFVGNINGADGILVFDDVSSANFDGEVAPDRTFGPPDRAPFDNPNLTIDAMTLDAAGNLYVSDALSSSPNRDRILVFSNPGAAQNSTEPSRTITSTDWGQHEDIFVDGDDVLYVVDGAEQVRMFADASTLDGDQTPSSTITMDRNLVSLEGVAVTRNGTGILADENNSAIYSFDNVAERSGTLSPDRVLDGFDTRLRGPRQIWLVEP